MLPPPTLFDRFIGSLPVFLALWEGFIITLILWFDGKAPNQFLPFILGFLAIVSNGRRNHVVADARWQEEKSVALGRPLPAPSRWRLLVLVPFWAAALFLAYHFTAGLMG
ncbi:hypothetical protein MWN34_10700 [Ancylobacter sp. 6x-1]|uniref:Uncharacterized protein n=1 Tax=Ancylobacter crimeensis TaxID=2579147 RepID=A0ABT0DBP7_9HYPH|nr:hypothetical protein [Ancylobacter crimeensis]MCK0197381.1 hypothetical protein [Ancylobacter crimeensis]